MSVWVTEGCSVKLDMDSDGYHMCLLFLILDFSKINFLLKITKNCFTGFPVFPRV